jgi:DNA-binding PadR family transcriptional regulator
MSTGSRSRSTPYAILGLLAFAPMSGYDIRREIDFSIGHFWSESFGQIYPALRELAAEGLIRPRPGTTGRERRVYEITAKGRRALLAWRAEPPRPAPVRNELLLKLFFGAPGAGGRETEWLAQLEKEQAESLRRFRRIRTQLLAEQGDHPSLPFWLAVLRFGERRARDVRAWSRETRAALRDIPSEAS